MGRPSLIVLWALATQTGAALAQEEAPGDSERPAAPVENAAVPVAGPPSSHFQLGVALMPMLMGRVGTGPSGHATSSHLDSTYGVALSFSYRIVAGLSVGVAPQTVFHLTSKDDAGYSVIDSEKEYDLLARIAYAYPVVPDLDVYAEVLPGYSFVSYNQIVSGSPAPRARGFVGAAGLGAAWSITDRFFAHVGVGYQLGFQSSHGIREQEVRTRFLRLAMGGGVKF